MGPRLMSTGMSSVEMGSVSSRSGQLHSDVSSGNSMGEVAEVLNKDHPHLRAAL